MGEKPDAVRARYRLMLEESVAEVGGSEREVELVFSIVWRAVEDALAGRPPEPIWGDILPIGL